MGQPRQEGSIDNWKCLRNKRRASNHKSENEMWVRLSSLYELRDKTTVYLLLQRFFDYQMEEGMTIGQRRIKDQGNGEKIQRSWS